MDKPKQMPKKVFNPLDKDYLDNLANKTRSTRVEPQLPSDDATRFKMLIEILAGQEQLHEFIKHAATLDSSKVFEEEVCPKMAAASQIAGEHGIVMATIAVIPTGDGTVRTVTAFPGGPYVLFASKVSPKYAALVKAATGLDLGMKDDAVDKTDETKEESND